MEPVTLSAVAQIFTSVVAEAIAFSVPLVKVPTPQLFNNVVALSVSPFQTIQDDVELTLMAEVGRPELSAVSPVTASPTAKLV